MKRVRTGTVGQADDQYVDSIRYDKDKAPEAGRKSDPNTGGYKNNVSETRRARSSPRRATRQHHHTGSWSKYQAGDKVPGIIVAPYTGDRGDISAKIVYKDGERISVFWRKLSTGSEFDVQFTDPKKEDAFGVAVFDNAQVRHAYSPGVLELKFE
jgi:hypothetical protein